MLNERQKLLRAPPGIWLVFRQWFCTRWSQTPPAPEQLQLQHNSAWWCDPPVLLHAQGHTWTCLAKPADPAQRCRPVVNVLCSELKSFSLPLPLSPPPPRPSLPPSASVSEDGEAALQSDSSHSGGEGGGQEQPLALLWLLPSVSVCLSSLLWRRRWLLAGFVQPFERLHSFSPSLFFCFYLLLWPQAWPPLSPTPNSTLTGMAKGNSSFFDTPLDSDRKVGPNCNEVMSLLASSPSQPAWTTTAWEREPKDCFCFFNDVCF